MTELIIFQPAPVGLTKPSFGLLMKHSSIVSF